MTKRKSKKRKDRNSSGTDSEVAKTCKQSRQRGPSGGSEECEFSVSDILSRTNSVSYGNNSAVGDSVFDSSACFDSGTNGEKDSSCDHKGEDKGVVDMAEVGKEPTNRDIMICLQAIDRRIDTVEQKLKSIEDLDKKMVDFDKELRGIRSMMNDQAKILNERVNKLEDKVDGTDINVTLMTSRVEELEKERNSLKDDVAYLKSQSMRNNLVFTGVTEADNESYEQTETKLRQHLVDAMKLTKETVNSIRFERVHRSPSEPQPDRIRSIIAKFTYFKDRETVRKQWKSLSGTTYNVFEQFPPEIVAKRKKLVPKMKEARRQGKSSYIVYDTLYVDGNAVKAE